MLPGWLGASEPHDISVFPSVKWESPLTVELAEFTEKHKELSGHSKCSINKGIGHSGNLAGRRCSISINSHPRFFLPFCSKETVVLPRDPCAGRVLAALTCPNSPSVPAAPGPLHIPA